MFERLEILIGKKALQAIKKQKILLIGLGGVGSYALEALIRNGFSNITVIDYDKIDITNLNRQLITTSKNIGTSKVIAAILRAKEINPDIKIDGQDMRLTTENIDMILKLDYDYIIDACDSLEVKFALMEKSLHYRYKLISCMGTAKKLNPQKLEITTLEKTYNDPIARILRKKIRDAKINKKFYVVSSSELPKEIDKLGTANLVPSVAGILCVSYIIDDILKSNQK